MAEKIRVQRSVLAEMLRLAPDSDDATIRAAMREAIAANEATIAADQARAVAAADEQALRAEDRRLVNAAFNDGRILNREQWVGYLAADRTTNRQLLASLAHGLRPDEQVVVDEGLEHTHQAVMARLGIAAMPATSRTVGRTVTAAAYQGSSGAPVDGLGIPIPQFPAPVRIKKGTPPEQWTERQRQDAALRRLGPRFHPGTKPPPAQDVWYQPSSNDHSMFVEGQGWVDNPNYRPKG